MTHSQKTTIQKILLTLVLACVIGACSGGSNPSPDNVDAAHTPQNNAVVDQNILEHNSTEQDAGAMSGTIIIEERNGKTIFDAYFSPDSATKLTAGPIDGVISTDECRVSELQSGLSSSPPAELGAANDLVDLVSVGAAVTIEARVGQFEALIKQQLEDLTVYAPEDRWQSAPLPDDAVLSFETASNLEQLETVEVRPLLPLVWLTPETGVMSNPATSLRWEASLDEQVIIKLRLSAIDFRDSQNPIVVTVSCDLIDDGSFTLPVVFQQQLPDDDMGIVVYAVRERVQKIQADSTSLSVVQLSYPAPLKP